MKWMRVENKELPKDRVFLALWKGAICLCAYDEDEEHYYISMYPAEYTHSMKVDEERMEKFTHYCELELPEDY